MGFSVQSIEYMDNAGVQSSGSRALGNTGGHNYWTRVLVQTDGTGCAAVAVSLDAICYNGAANQYYSSGAQLVVSESSSPGSYVGSAANLTATYMGSNQQRWVFSGTVSVSMRANASYYLFILPCWTEPDTFVSYLNADPTIYSASSWQTYPLSISAGTGSSIAVYRIASLAGAALGQLVHGSTLFYGDTVQVYFSANTGYQLTLHTVNGADFPSGGSGPVTSAVYVVALAQPLPYTLSISAGTGSTITVERNGTRLSDGDTIYYNDALVITFGADAGWLLDTHTVNGVSFTSGGTHIVTGAVSVAATATQQAFLLTISASVGSTAVVNRTGSPVAGAPLGVLSSGDSVYISDVLQITFSANTGYNLAQHTVNGVSFTSGDSHTVSSAVTVTAAAAVKSYQLTINAGTGSEAVVTRTSSPLQGAATGNLPSGSTIYYNDELSISFSALTGYELTSKTINSAPVSGSRATHVVSDAVIVAVSAAVRRFVLTLSAGRGTAITVSRTSSPKQGAPTGALSSGDSIYYSDTLTVSFSVSAGYTVASRTINGTAAAVTNAVTVVSAVTAAATATLNEYLLQITQSPSGVITTVLRTESPVGSGSIGQLGNGATLYYGDVLVLTFSISRGYELKTHTVNGEDFESGDPVTVADNDIEVVVLATATGFVYIKNEPYFVHIGNGTAYDRFISYVGNGSSYDQH